MKAFVRRPAMWGVTAALALVLVAVAKPSVAQHFDVLVTSDSGKLFLGGFDDDNTVGVIPDDQMRVFEGEAGAPLVPGPYVTEDPGEPGFRGFTQSALNGFYRDFVPGPGMGEITGINPVTPNQYSPLTASTDLTFNWQPISIGLDTRNLFFWDGLGAVDFVPVSSSVELGLSRFSGMTLVWEESIDGSSSGVISGSTIQQTTGTGTAHTHLFTSIEDSGGPPDQGFYLYSLQLGMTGFTSSDPLYFVFGALDPSALTVPELEAFEVAHGEAADWVQANLVAPVPEPSTYALMGLAAIALPLVHRFRNRR